MCRIDSANIQRLFSSHKFFLKKYSFHTKVFCNVLYLSRL